MPTRMIRESLLDSHRYGGLSDAAKLLFFHMLLIADDLGCLTVTPTFLRRRAFYNSPTNEHIAKLIAELVDVDLVRPYQHNGGEYAFIPRFRQRLQRNTLRHPQPPSALLHGDDDAIDKFNKINNVTENPTVGQRRITVGQPPEVEVEVEVEGFGSRGNVSNQTKNKPKAKTLAQAPFVLPEWIPQEHWDAWVEARTKKRNAPTDYAKRLAVSKLKNFKERGHSPAQILMTAAFSGWTGLFEPEERK